MLGASLEEAKRDVEKEFTINFDEDMNLLSDKDLKRRKELMDLQFEKNRVQVDDPNFIYDKQVRDDFQFLYVLNNFFGYLVVLAKYIYMYMFFCRLNLQVKK